MSIGNDLVIDLATKAFGVNNKAAFCKTTLTTLTLFSMPTQVLMLLKI